MAAYRSPWKVTPKSYDTAAYAPFGAGLSLTLGGSHLAKEASLTAPFTLHELAQFTGTEHWYRHALNRNVLFTDGAKYVADQAGAYWLLDEIALIQHYDKHIAAE